MRLRNVLIVSGLVIPVLIVGGIYAAMRAAQSAIEQMPEVLDAIQAEQRALMRAAKVDDSPALDIQRRLTLDGDTTTVTLTCTNQTKGATLDFAPTRLILGKVEPNEKRDLPIRVTQLAPGATHQIDLHYHKVPWNLSGEESAQAHADEEEEWHGTVKGGQKHIDVKGAKFTITIADQKIDSKASGIGPVDLDKASARALKQRRDSESKGVSAKKVDVAPRDQAPKN
jgi:hypothetical protein